MNRIKIAIASPILVATLIFAYGYIGHESVTAAAAAENVYAGPGFPQGTRFLLSSHWSGPTDVNLAQNRYPGVSAAEVSLRRQFFRQMIGDGEIKMPEYVESGETPVNLLETEKIELNKVRLSTQSTRGQQPPIPYEDHGACPFECCTYRQWTVKTRTLIRQDRNASSPAIFTLQRGERVTGMTGVVITTQSGQARALKPASIGGMKVRPGEVVYLLTYAGEGSYNVWYKGKVEEIAIEGDDVFKLIREPQSVWWVKVRNRKGQIGWTNLTRNFDGMDACG